MFEILSVSNIQSFQKTNLLLWSSNFTKRYTMKRKASSQQSWDFSRGRQCTFVYPFNDIFIFFSSVAQSCLALCDPMNRSTPGLPVHRQLPEFSQTHVRRVGDALQPSHPLCPLLLLPPIPPSIRVFSSESTLCMRWPKYWSFSFSISPSKEHPGLISFRMAWLDLLAVQGTLKSLLQHHSSKPSVLWHSAFLTVHSHIHTWPLEKP